MDKPLNSNFTIKEQRVEFTRSPPEEPNHSTTPGRVVTLQPPQNSIKPTSNFNVSSGLTSQMGQKVYSSPFIVQTSSSD